MMRSSGLRTSFLPVEHLEAELLAAPLASAVAFERGLVELDYDLRSRTGPRPGETDTGALWRETERQMLRAFPGMSIDELLIRRDRAWFSDGSAPQAAPVTMLRYVRAMAKVFLATQSGQPRLRGPEPYNPRDHRHANELHEPLKQRRRWRWLTFALPQDLLLAAIDSPQDHMEMVSPYLNRRLTDSGVAETHLHLKAALEFPTLWASLQRSLASNKAHEEMLASPGAEFDGGRTFAAWMIRCALARMALAGYLSSRSPQTRGLNQYLQKWVPLLVVQLGGIGTRLTFRNALAELYLGRFFPRTSPGFYALCHLYRLLVWHGSIFGQPSRSAASGIASGLDPLAAWFGQTTHCSPEYGFIRAAMDYIENRGKSDVVFARFFWQIQRLRVRFYRHVVQRPMTPGLLWFTRTYARLSKPRGPLKIEDFLRTAVRLSGFETGPGTGSGTLYRSGPSGHGRSGLHPYGTGRNLHEPGGVLRSLEVRITPESSIADLLKRILELESAFRDFPQIETGVVFHFSRTRGEDAEKGYPSPRGRLGHEDPGAFLAGTGRLNPTGYKFETYYNDRRKEAVALADLLYTHPVMLELVRGVDLCTDELGVPLWVLKPLVEHVLDAGRYAASVLGRLGSSVRPLHVSVHAGEDFVHLLGGIRRVSEAAEYLRMGEGDRIGHGVALGVNPYDWADHSNGLAVPRGERLLDLLWARRVAMGSDNPVLLASLSRITGELNRLGDIVFEKVAPTPPTVRDLDKILSRLHQRWGLIRSGFPSGPTPRKLPGEWIWVDAWLRNPGVFHRSQQAELVEVSEEVDLVAQLQKHVLQCLARRGVTIEINPSSNLLIGHLGDLANHPLWRICPPRPGMDNDSQVKVCIASDDPVTFATRLPDEYQLLADTLIEGGLKPQEVDAWIERSRCVGLDSRFTVPRSGRGLMSIFMSNPAPPLIP